MRTIVIRRLLALALVVLAGLAWRKAPLGLPFFAWKYGGSALWGTAVYLAVGLALPKARLSSRVAISLMIAVCVELSRLVETPWLDAFRATLAGELLLGKIFSPWNVVAYAAGILAAAAIERR